jgi:arylsulfatase A-like enzyme
MLRPATVAAPMTTISARTALAALAVLATLLAIGCDGGGNGRGASTPGQPKNVLLITLDTTRADYIGCYGAGAGATPNLDALAKEGTRFDLAMATASVTPVAHAAILTGLDNSEHGLRVLYAHGGYRLPKGVPTLATVLKERGFRTLAVHSAFPVAAFFGFKKGFDVFESLEAEMRVGVKSPNQASWDVTRFQRRSDETTAIVERHLGAASEPFFLWIHYWDPHDWVRLPPDEYLPPEQRDASGNPVRPNKELYAAEIRYMDSQLGRLFDALRKKGVWDDTLVVVIADHGQGLFDHGWAAHRLLYQEQIRVPLIVRVPGATQAPAVSELVRSIDVMPTVLDYLGVAPPKPVTGRSLRPLIDGRPDEPRIAFADQINGYDMNAEGIVDKRPLDDFLYMASDGAWKLIYRPSNPDQSELYDLKGDPKEARNLYATEAEHALRLRKLLAQHKPFVAAPFEKLEDDGDGTAAQDALNALGYIGNEIVDAKWAWTCPEHMSERWEKAQRCPQCREWPLLIAK